MTKVLFDIENSKLENLDAILAEKGWSRAEAIRYAIDMLLEDELKQDSMASEAFGLWADKKIDGLEFQKNIRKEWE